jgi:hypothetical protein
VISGCRDERAKHTGENVCPIRADVSRSETDAGGRGTNPSEERTDGVALRDRGLQDLVMPDNRHGVEEIVEFALRKTAPR